MHLKMQKIAFALGALSFIWPAPMQIYWLPQDLYSNMAAISLFWNTNMPKTLYCWESVATCNLSLSFWDNFTKFCLQFIFFLVHRGGRLTWIGHFQVPKIRTFRARLSAKPFLWKWVLFAWNYFHINGLALSLALKQRLGATWKWLGKGLLREPMAHRLLPIAIFMDERQSVPQRLTRTVSVEKVDNAFIILKLDLPSKVACTPVLRKTATMNPSSHMLNNYKSCSKLIL